MTRLKLWLMIIGAYLSISGLVTFALFIHEEAIQTVMFGTWPAKDVRQYEIVLTGTNLMRKINLSAKIINYSIGWIQPLAFFSYRAYAKATDYYILSTEAEAFAHAPHLFVGKQVSLNFVPNRIETLNDGKYLLTNGRIGVVHDTMPQIKAQMITGILKEQGKYLIIGN
jgi:hypothetical protein